MNKNKRILSAFLFTALLAACASHPRYQEPGAELPTATIEGEGTVVSRCGLSSNPICKVAVHAVDGALVGDDTSVKILAGVHDVILVCITRADVSTGNLTGERRSITFNAAAGSVYRIKPAWIQSRCEMKLVEAAKGQEVREVKSGGEA